jgi:tripartite-type tricarboxylate transporter receptor subunit TctC
MAPVQTPRAVIARLNRNIVAALAAPEIRERMAAEGIEPAGSTPEQFSAIIKSDIAKWTRVVREAKIKPE